MIRIIPIFLSLFVLGGTLIITVIWPMAVWSFLVILPTIMLSIYDMLQHY